MQPQPWGKALRAVFSNVLKVLLLSVAINNFYTIDENCLMSIRGPFSSHDFVGRAIIDTAKLKPRTEYILKYSIWDSTNTSDRKEKGEIMVSFSAVLCQKFLSVMI